MGRANDLFNVYANCKLNDVPSVCNSIIEDYTYTVMEGYPIGIKINGEEIAVSYQDLSDEAKAYIDAIVVKAINIKGGIGPFDLFGNFTGVKKNVNQEEIDRFFGASQSKTEDKPLVKGIQKKTLDVFMEYLNQNTNENEIVVDNNNTGEVITARRPGFNTVIDKADDIEIDQIQDYTLPSDIEVIEVENTQYVVSTGLDTYYFESCTKEEVLESARVDHNLEITSEGELITNYFTHIIYFDGTADSYETISDEELYNICTTQNVIQVIRETSNRILFDAIEINNEVIESERPVIPAFEEPIVEEPIMEEPIEEEYQETTSNNILDESFSIEKSLCNSNVMDITNFIYGNNLLETPQYIDFYDVLDNDIDRYAVGYFAALYNNIKTQAYECINREATNEAVTGFLNVYDQFTNGYSLSFDIDGDIIELTYNDITPKAKILISSMVQPFTMINYNFQLESGKTTSDLLSEILTEQENAIGAINEEGYSNDTSEDEGMTYIIRP